MKLLPIMRRKNGKKGGNNDPHSFEVAAWAYVDDKYYHRLSQHRWVFSDSRKLYAVRRQPGGYIMLHSEVARLYCKSEAQDHRDCNPLNNQIANLRPASHSRNAGNSGISRNNTSGFKGVSRRPNGKYEAKITAKSVGSWTIYLGSYGTAQEAALAYDKAAVELFGEYARTNKMLGLV